MSLQRVAIDPACARFRGACAELRQAFERREAVPFLGAGISAQSPSNLPLAEDLHRPLRHVLATAAAQAWPAEERADVADRLEPIYELPHLEAILDSLQYHQRWQVRAYLEVLRSTATNDNHNALARLAGRGYLPCCITMNLDTLIEQAISDSDIAAPPALSQTWIPLLGERLGSVHNQLTTIIKPHGSFRPPARASGIDPLLPSLSEIGSSPHPRNRAAIERAVGCRGVLLVAGYGRLDWDVWPIFDGLRSRIRSLFWIAHTEVDVHHTPSWLGSDGRDDVLFVGNAVHLFRMLADLPEPCNEVDGPHREPSADAFLAEDARDYTAHAAAGLLPSTDVFRTDKRRILRFLLRRARATYNTRLLGTVLESLSWRRHLDHERRSALALQRVAVDNLRSCDGAEPDQLAHSELFLAKLHLAHAMRSNPRVGTLARVWGGLLDVARAIRLQVGALRRARGDTPRTKAALEWATFVHRALLGCVVWCRWFNPMLPLGFRMLAWRYNSILARHVLYMDREYYQIRSIEAQLMFPRPGLVEDCRRHVELLESSLGRAKSGHRTLLEVCRALLAHHDRDTATASRHLDRAHEKWESASIATGLKRVIAYRVHLRLTTPKQARRAWRVEPDRRDRTVDEIARAPDLDLG